MHLNKLYQKQKGNIQIFFTFFWMLSLLYFIISIFILLIGQNVYQESYSNSTQKTINSILPQGWGFFTRNPKETKYRIYLMKGNELQIVNRKNSSSSNAFGLSRKYRRFGYEFTKIYTSIKSKRWNKVNTQEIPKLKQNISDTVYIDSSFLLIKEGSYLIEKYENIPWAWSNKLSEERIIEYICIQIIKNEFK